MRSWRLQGAAAVRTPPRGSRGGQPGSRHGASRRRGACVAHRSGRLTPHAATNGRCGLPVPGVGFGAKGSSPAASAARGDRHTRPRPGPPTSLTGGQDLRRMIRSKLVQRRPGSDVEVRPAMVAQASSARPGTSRASLRALAALLGVAPGALLAALERAGVRGKRDGRATEDEVARVFGDNAARAMFARMDARERPPSEPEGDTDVTGDGSDLGGVER